MKRECHAVIQSCNLYPTQWEVGKCVRSCLNHLWSGVTGSDLTACQRDIEVNPC